MVEKKRKKEKKNEKKKKKEERKVESVIHSFFLREYMCKVVVAREEQHKNVQQG